jgi:hypothetical protein
MAAIPSAVPSAVEPSAAGEWQNEQLGTLSGTDASYGFAETTGSPANIPGGQVSPTLPGNPFSEQLDFIGEAVSPNYSPPMVTGAGPSIPYEASVPQAQAAHGIVNGRQAQRDFGDPHAPNQYWMTQVKTAAQAPVTSINPQGMNDYVVPGVATFGQVIQSGDHTNLNTGIGYYLQESDRPFYNTLAATAPVQEIGTTGYQMPYGGVESQGYNDGGIPTVYSGTPDPYVAPSADGAEAPPLDGGWA